jgi:hypothetical protein
MKALVVSAACCYPGLAGLDDQVKTILTQVSSEVGVSIDVKIVTASTAMFGGVIPKPLLNTLMNKFRQNETGPAVIIDGEIVSYGIPRPDELKAILIKHANVA